MPTPPEQSVEPEGIVPPVVDRSKPKRGNVIIVGHELVAHRACLG